MMPTGSHSLQTSTISHVASCVVTSLRLCTNGGAVVCKVAQCGARCDDSESLGREAGAWCTTPSVPLSPIHTCTSSPHHRHISNHRHCGCYAHPRQELRQGVELSLLLLLLLLGSLACLVPPWGAAAVRVHPRDVSNLAWLASEWNGFNGSDTWSLSYADCRAMEGIRCDRDGRVIAIELGLKNFQAPIPAMISRFTRLRYLTLLFCQLTGPLPNTLCDLPSLVSLNLGGNSISGTLPDGFSRLVSLEYLILGVNRISGPIDLLSSLVHLTHLNLRQNFFNGSLPSELGNFTTLTVLNFDGNLFSGSIPPSMGEMSLLQQMVLSFNQLSGTIPDSLGHLRGLTHLALAGNQLTGSIPDSFSALDSLTDLILMDNLLSGSIPTALASLPKLRAIMASSNQLSGSIPAALGDLLLLDYLSLSYNPMSGSIPTAIGKLTNLMLLDLSGNQFYGTVPSSLSDLSKLQYLFLTNNQFWGTIEPITRTMRNLRMLFLSWNQFSGRLPSPASSTLEQYQVDTNFFTHGEVKFKNCSAVTWTTDANCLAASASVCGRASTQRTAAVCAAFCGVEIGATGPVCGGHGYCSVNAFIGEGECVCDPNYMLDSSNTNACVAGATGASLESGSAYVSLWGSASVLSNGSILLTTGTPNQQGAAFASPTLRLFHFPDKRSRCGTELGFLAAFSFAMTPGNHGSGGEGLAFVVAAASPGKGASVGLGGVGRRSVGVEFDSVLSVKHSDPNDNHVGVNVGGSPVSLASATAPLILNDAQTKHTWIRYDPTSGGTLRVFLSSDPVQPLTPTLTASVSLCSILKPTASDSLFLFGFVALSGSQPQAHTILSWNVTTDATTLAI
ncbi:hypothetical protein CLOP_g10692 [Closterium sp. NIES-67]|nr:hypothetical protein CLOP_g10692 [Closterium sp. NIES-67]